MSFDLVIFDFDGVLVDSETLANRVLADELSALGCPTTLHEAFDQYMGYDWDDCLARIGARWGAAPAELRSRVDAAIEARVATELRLVDGAGHFLDRLGSRPSCIASSSHPDWLRGRLAMFELAERFEGRLFSAAVHVARGKPHPDIYLHAAEAMGAAPARTLVIEDSAVGVAAGVAAGMAVVGLLAGTHVRDGHGARLQDAGAQHLARSYGEVAELMGLAA